MTKMYLYLLGTAVEWLHVRLMHFLKITFLFNIQLCTCKYLNDQNSWKSQLVYLVHTLCLCV